MSDLIKISTLTLEIEGQTIQVTPDGAKELMEALKNMFDNKTIIVKEVVPVYPTPIHPRPYFEWWYSTCSESDSTQYQCYNSNKVKISAVDDYCKLNEQQLSLNM